jgi:hypothetical protein
MNNDRLTEQRTIALAKMFLTRDKRVLVIEEQGSGFDLQVELSQGRFFGVELKGRPTLRKLGTVVAPGQVRLQGPLRESLRGHQQRMRLLQFPLLYIIFALDQDRGFYGWLREPIVPDPPAVARRLATPAPDTAIEWISDTHRTVVGQVVKWYGAIEAVGGD